MQKKLSIASVYLYLVSVVLLVIGAFSDQPWSDKVVIIGAVVMVAGWAVACSTELVPDEPEEKEGEYGSTL
jgi:dipeptide/tripeptide permease